MNYIGIDVGGTKIYGAKFSADFQTLDSFEMQTEAHLGPQTVIHQLIEIIGKLKDSSTQGLGIAWAGMVNSDKNTVMFSPNLDQCEHIPIGKTLSEWFGLPVIVENDTRCFAIGEQRNSFPDIKNFLGIIVGTGIAAGVIMDGKPLNGFQNVAGEIGHQVLAKKTPEDLFAGPALEKLFKASLEEVLQWPKSKIEKKLGTRIDLFAQWLFNNALALNPHVISLGGGVGINFWPLFFPKIKQKINRLAKKNKVPMLKFDLECSEIRNAGATGAAILIASQD